MVEAALYLSRAMSHAERFGPMTFPEGDFADSCPAPAAAGVFAGLPEIVTGAGPADLGAAARWEGGFAVAGAFR